MELRSQIIELDIPGSSGKPIRYYTYDGYLQQHQRRAIREYRRVVQRRSFTSAFLLGLLVYYGSRKSRLPDLHLKKWVFPSKGLFSGFLAFVGGYLFFDYIGVHQTAEFQTSVAHNSKHLPLWRNKNFAVNPDKAYFQLIDNQHNQISIFHSGLTPQAASKILPDLIIGGIPQKPSDPLIHLH